MNKLSHELLGEMFDADLRISTIFHVQGSLTGMDSLSPGFEDFISDDYDQWGKRFEEWLPGRGKVVYDRIVKDYEEGNDEHFRSEVSDFLQHHCPATFIVQVERTIPECLIADPSGEGLGTFRQGWGYYAMDTWFVDTIEEAVQKSLAKAAEKKRKTWQQAIDEGRVHERRSPSEFI